MLMWIIILIVLLPPILMGLNLLLFKKNFLSREKYSPFECGFDPKLLTRNSFSLKFYLIAIIFLIFDIEISLVLPIPLISQFSSQTPLILLMCFFLLILLMGLGHEWKEGALNWLK
uniref:NADH-ubiquinone oxidoreductase chain 3 n=1 Tax=Friesea antarctica TaxID=2720488 RepID=B2BSE4_9HEXA|nr:NADH dehydrogenase subunit 3 [Friesea antarctica]ABS57597.1 NADH dehydrogenase subunit 3 [Friesea antarctica]